MKRILFFDYDAQNRIWNSIPESFWRFFLKNFILSGDLVGFKGLTSNEQIHEFKILNDWDKPAGNFSYQPYCIPASVVNVKEYLEDVLIFEIDQQAKNVLSEISLSELYLDNELIPTEELVFIRDGELLATASNIDNHLHFYKLTPAELKHLEDFGPEVRCGLSEI